MDADWYVDPLGRFEGRYFDGTAWTDEVSDGGALATDPDWPPTDVAEPELQSEPEPNLPAVSSVDTGVPRQATLVEESPARPVAVLDDSSRVGSSDRSGPRTRWLTILGTAIILAGLAALILPRLGSDDAAIDEQPATTAADRDVEVDEPEGLVDAGTQFDEAETVQVGRLQIVNGASVLADLEAWHRDDAAGRGVELPVGASCWFGRLGDAAVQSAQCGPVGSSEEAEFLFDKVPLRFDDTAGGQIAQPVVDATERDQVLPNSLELIGSVDGPAPPEGASTVRGERGGG